MPIAQVKKGLTVWHEGLYVEIHNLARNGLSDYEIAKALGIHWKTLESWCRQLPRLVEALDAAREIIRTPADGTTAFFRYVHERLPAHLIPLWQQIVEWDKTGLMDSDTIDEFFHRHGVRIRQHLFVYAMVATNFNPSAACRMVGVTRCVLDKWSRDNNFKELMQELHWHKKNFYEAALMRLVDRGDTTATIFVNRTFNRDRGYNEKIELVIEEKGKGVDIDSLNLPLETRKQILLAMRAKAAEEQGEPTADALLE